MCLGTSNTDATLEACPPSYPVDCGDDYCCPAGTTCTANGCLQANGSTSSGSDVVCASNAIDTDFGVCSLDFCIAESGSGCESYYLVNGGRISCNGCATDGDCVQRAAEACTDSGVSNNPSNDPSTNTECCGPNDVCDWANDDVCDCGGDYSWDWADCAEEDSATACSIGDVGVGRSRMGGLLTLALLSLTLVTRRKRR
jgi:hypothetical protein